jgi:prophage antirepressor-like protein/phage antirepressor YoqD-like protein
MQNELKIIRQQEVLGKDFKIYGDFENPLFLAKDVAAWIEHSDVSTMLRKVDEDEKLTQTMFVSGQNRTVWCLTENGLYEVLMQSRKPIAKAFKKEVKEILKSIRKHSGYIKEELLDELLKSRETAKEYLKMLKSGQGLSSAGNKLFDKTLGLHDEISTQAYCENVLECVNAIPISVIAKDYGMSAEKFNKLLYSLGVQYKVGGVWVLYAKYGGNGYTATRTFVKSNGKAIIYTIWLQSGREFLYRRLKKYGIAPEYERNEQLFLECDFYE